ncbi:glutamine-hydrolyzing GMP synthase [Candidatus Peregrinibacteria bacterium]|nr:glutamine-hydrolyzing GMP synthase [Candidatus Peregrinibacteria bacterium]MBI3816868.1 glutamine-hydrolyzing GMP synthase [Candidatus Peregrinibacteria bacterium]
MSPPKTHTDPIHPGSIVILDCGGQYAHLIANRVRRLAAYSEIRIAETPAEELKNAAGIILSGGPQSVYEKGSPQADPKIFDLGIPILGLCYGHQLIAHVLGGEVTMGKVREYGRTDIEVLDRGSSLFRNLSQFLTVWMSHGDEVTKLPEGFTHIARSQSSAIAAMADEERKIFGLQFHVEVTHTERGLEILKNFLDLCTSAPWSMEGFSHRIAETIKREVGDRNVFMLVSGGVDSTVAFTLLNKMLGTDRVQGLLVDTGLMRKNEVPLIKGALQKLGITNLHVEDASEEFFCALEGITDPEEKRHIIGNTFLDVQKRVSEELRSAKGELRMVERIRKSQIANRNFPSEKEWMLGQGTIYPDTIETGVTKHADQIKTHHNRIPLIQEMIKAGAVIEPLKELYKDEVRALGEELGLPHELVWRHPFPGPGLGVRMLCAASPSLPDVEKLDSQQKTLLPSHATALPVQSVGVQGDGRTYRHALALFSHHSCRVTPEERALATTIPNSVPLFNRVLLCTSYNTPPTFAFSPGFVTRERADVLREADAIVDEEMRQAELENEIWQFPVVLLPLGVMRGGESIVLRPIRSTDAMTAEAYPLPEDVLQRMTDRLMALPGIEAVFLDLTNKPPATIEWE